MLLARRAGTPRVECSLDLRRSSSMVELSEDTWGWNGRQFPYPEKCKERTIYYWSGDGFAPVARYASSLVKLIPTDWGPPTFEIDGIKMLPTAHLSPYEDARRKVSLIHPRGKVILDTCGGLGYFAAWCLRGQAAHVHSYEKNPDVMWLRDLNPWSPRPEETLTLTQAGVEAGLEAFAGGSVEAILHDPPRFGIAGELYSQQFYDQLARVLARRGTLFHYTGSPNKIATGRDLPHEVSRRLRHAGFNTNIVGDGTVKAFQQPISGAGTFYSVGVH